ncbi:MAG: 3-deoxy-manno-octulosonate cytidylyltransferase [Pirellulales bacterium]
MVDQCVLVIPARRHSTRLPDKLLLRAGGKTVLQHTFEAACQARLPEQVLIATDDDQIARESRQFGATVVMTSSTCSNGTDRVAEAIRNSRRKGIQGKDFQRTGIVVNLQGDEPEINPTDIDHLIERLQENRAASMATLATPIHDRNMVHDPACVKVVFDALGRALYFSRSPIPYLRDEKTVPEERNSPPKDTNISEDPRFFQHIGIYAYRCELLLRLADLPSSPLEQAEKLEQLRVLEQGDTIMVAQVDEATRGIDTPEDFALFAAKFSNQNMAA